MEATVSATKVSDATMSRDFDYRCQQVFAPGAGHPPRTRNPGSSNTGSACVSIAPTRPCAPGSGRGQGSSLATNRFRWRLLYPLSYRGNVRSPVDAHP
jgi:hypothetical protein